MRDITQPPPAIKITQQKQEAQFICSACGADRGCNCNAPAVEKLAEMVEQRRQAKRAFDERKRQQKQQSGNITNDAINDPIEELCDNNDLADRVEARCAAKWKAFTAENEIVAKLANEIVDAGYRAMAERFQYDKQTMTRLAKARDGLRNIEWF